MKNMVSISTEVGFSLKYVLEWLWSHISSYKIGLSVLSPVLKQLKYRVISISSGESMWYMDVERRLHVLNISFTVCSLGTILLYSSILLCQWWF